MKFAVPGFATIENFLKGSGARATAALDEADHYFNAPDRDFARTDEALRLRRIGPANFVTYKGPKRDAVTKTRTEIEVGLAEGDPAAADFIQILKHLGYRPVAVVRKHRRIFQLPQDGFSVEVCLDEVEDVGQFVELEIVAPEDRFEEGQAQLLRLASEWDLKQAERRSYLELLLAKRGQV